MNFMFSWQEQYSHLFSKQTPFDIDMQKLRLSMAPAIIKSKDTSEEGCLYSALNLSYVVYYPKQYTDDTIGIVIPYNDQDVVFAKWKLRDLISKVTKTIYAWLISLGLNKM